MVTLLFVLVILLIGFGGFLIYKSTMVHELHNLKTKFEDKKEDIQELIKDRKDGSDFNYEYYQGELEEIDELTSIIDDELEDLKNFDFTS